MVNPTSIFLPLYLYPYNSSWDGISKSIAQYPDINFQIVVAPNLINVVPDVNYVTHLQVLNNYTNVQTLGYVSTSWATRNITAVQEEIKAYASWIDYAAANIQVSGIFFDEAPSANTTEKHSYMSNVTTFAKSLLGPGRNKIVYNPGVMVDSSWFKLADEIVVFEDTWASFNYTRLRNIPPQLENKSIYLIHNFTGWRDLQDDVVSKLTDHNLAGVYITTREGYSSISTLWNAFCESLSENLSDFDDGDDGQDDGEDGEDGEDGDDGNDGNDEEPDDADDDEGDDEDW
jgi:hypothetical protein